MAERRFLVDDHEPVVGEPVAAVLAPVEGCPFCGSGLTFLTRSRGGAPTESVMLACPGCHRHWQVQVRLSQAPRSTDAATRDLRAERLAAAEGRAPHR